VIDHLSSRLSDKKICVAFVYCDYQEKSEQQTASSLIATIIKQILITCERFPDKLGVELLEKKKKGGNLELQDALQFLSQVISSFQRTYVCVDALDECPEEHRVNLIQSLRGLSAVDGHESTINLFFTGRPHIKEHIKPSPSNGSPIPSSVTLEANTEDIATYIVYKLDTIENYLKWRNPLEIKLLQKLWQQHRECQLQVHDVIHKY
jgi:hypothetical protein